MRQQPMAHAVGYTMSPRRGSSEEGRGVFGSDTGTHGLRRGLYDVGPYGAPVNRETSQAQWHRNPRLTPWAQSAVSSGASDEGG